MHFLAYQNSDLQAAQIVNDFKTSIFLEKDYIYYNPYNIKMSTTIIILYNKFGRISFSSISKTMASIRSHIR